MIFYHNLAPTIWTAVADNGIVPTLRLPCPPRERRPTASRIWERVLDGFASRTDIDFAYPTRRMSIHSLQGKRAGHPPVPPDRPRKTTSEPAEIRKPR